jgi:heat-inducible transcriptional repressor
MAYRFYVNFLMQQQISPPDDVQEILREYEHYEAHIQKLLEHTSRTLADLTHYTSLVLAPLLRRTLFKYMRLVPADEKRVILVLLTNTGAIINNVIELEQEISIESLERMTNILNERLSGMYLEDIQMDFLEKIKQDLHDVILLHVESATREALAKEEKGFIYDGAANLFDVPEFHDLERLRAILEFLEEEELVADILKKTLSNQGLKVSIGGEHKMAQANECTFITATYEIDGTPVGSIGIMGPTRMPYQRIIPVVNAFADMFSKKLAKLGH